MQACNCRPGRAPSNFGWPWHKLCTTSTQMMASAGFHERQVAPKLHRNRFLQEQRARMLDAVRATYGDFFEDSYVTSRQLNKLQAGACFSAALQLTYSQAHVLSCSQQLEAARAAAPSLHAAAHKCCLPPETQDCQL